MAAIRAYLADHPSYDRAEVFLFEVGRTFENASKPDLNRPLMFTDYFPRRSTPLQRHADISRQSVGKVDDLGS